MKKEGDAIEEQSTENQETRNKAGLAHCQRITGWFCVLWFVCSFYQSIARVTWWAFGLRRTRHERESRHCPCCHGSGDPAFGAVYRLRQGGRTAFLFTKLLHPVQQFCEQEQLRPMLPQVNRRFV